MERVWPAFIGLLGTRVGATIFNRANQLINKLIDQKSVLQLPRCASEIRKIIFFSRIVFQIIKLHQI